MEVGPPVIILEITKITETRGVFIIYFYTEHDLIIFLLVVSGNVIDTIL